MALRKSFEGGLNESDKETHCINCKISEPLHKLERGICIDCKLDRRLLEIRSHKENIKPDHVDNPYLIIGFWHFLLISGVVALFFPWSIIISLVFLGLENTKFLVAAILHDFIKITYVILIGIFSLTAMIFSLITYF